MKYETKIYIDAEQFNPEVNVPGCVFSNGKASPLTDDRCSYFARTAEGATHINVGDYIINHDNGTHAVVPKEIFEKLYVQSSK